MEFDKLKNMLLISMTEENRNFVILFIKKYERFCVELAYNIRKNNENIYILSKKSTISSESEILGIIQISKSLHFYIPFLTEAKNDEDIDELKSTLTKKIDFNKIKCVSGESEMSKFFLNLLQEQGRQPYQTNEYILMGHFAEEGKKLVYPPEELSSGDEIVCLNGCNPEIIYQLQKEYLKEEVIPKGKELLENVYKISAQDILKKQLIYAVVADDRLVAKANTNAIGFDFVQIGGVYTEPLYRRNYYAWFLVLKLCEKIIKNKKNPCLYVNKKNLKAMSLYTKMGFSVYGNSTIAYY